MPLGQQQWPTPRRGRPAAERPAARGAARRPPPQPLVAAAEGHPGRAQQGPGAAGRPAGNFRSRAAPGPGPRGHAAAGRQEEHQLDQLQAHPGEPPERLEIAPGLPHLEERPREGHEEGGDARGDFVQQHPGQAALQLQGEGVEAQEADDGPEDQGQPLQHPLEPGARHVVLIPTGPAGRGVGAHRRGRSGRTRSRTRPVAGVAAAGGSRGHPRPAAPAPDPPFVQSRGLGVRHAVLRPCRRADSSSHRAERDGAVASVGTGGPTFEPLLRPRQLR